MATIGKLESSAQIAASEGTEAPVSLARLLVCLDASEHADRALEEATRLAQSSGGTVLGIHAYAAKLHDNRFRQMEGGLPERYRKEAEMEHQREVHDDLITRGLGIVSDSYHDVAARVCASADVAFERLSPEGKNYRRIVESAASGEFDVVALGAVGLGRTDGAIVGTVCERVARRSPIDTLIIRDSARSIGDGPIVVGLDGSARSFGALVTALDIADRLDAEIQAVAAYDPYFHYVAFNKISGALSEEASQQFRFKDQEKLHEEIIDSGIARIYQSHLDVGREVAREKGVDLQTKLLEGKPWQAIAEHCRMVGASLVVVGKTGVHADPYLDIGGNAENLLRLSPCSVWLGQATFTPPFEAVAKETITWTEEAEEMMTRVPESARAMVRMAILRMAQESGHTVVTSGLIEEATQRFCPDRGGRMEQHEEIAWSAEANGLLTSIGDPTVATSVRLRAEKKARTSGADRVEPEHVSPFLAEGTAPAARWNAAALARLAQVPEMVRGMVRRRVEAHAVEREATEIDLDLVEAAIAESRESMGESMRTGGHKLGLDGSGAEP